MNKTQTVLFDPGYAPIVIDSIGKVGYNYYIFSAIPDLKLKRLRFKQTAKNLEHHLKINISFYLGCLFWASYITQFENCTIEGNKLLGENCEESEYTGEIDFLIDFIENKYPRDYKYFNNKPYIPDERYLPILKTYREFLILNKGFVDCSNTSQIIMPKNLKTPSKDELEEVKHIVFKAIEDKNLELLLDGFNFIF